MNSAVNPKTSMRPILAAALACTAHAACLSDLSIPDDADIVCEKGDTCPEGLVCAENIGRCVDPALVNLDAVVVTVDGVPDPQVISDVEPFHETTVSFLATRAPRKFVSRANAAIFPCTEEAADGDAVRFSCSVTAPPARADGEMSVFGFATDELGAETNAWVSVVIDRAAPNVVIDEVVAEHIPADDNPRAGSFTSASTYGGTVRIALVFDEPVTLAAVHLGPFALEDAPSDTALTFVLRATLPRMGEAGADALADGALDLTLTATDRVGNVSDVVLEDLVAIDVTAPAPLDGASDAFALRRTPWGAPEGVGAARSVAPPHTEVRISTAALASDVAAVRVSKGGEPAAARQVDRMSETFDVPLVGDVRAVDVEAVDEAGNVSAPSRVAHVEWIASFVGKVAGSMFENPHVAYEVGSLGGSVSGQPRVEVDAPAALALADDDVRATLVRRAWQRTDTDAPPGRRGSAFAFDAARGRIVSANGLLQAGAASITMELVGERWIERAVESPPPAREMASTYDRVRGRVLAFGGDPSNEVLDNRIWEFDGIAWAGREATGPGGRYGAAMAFDAARGVAVLFGGRDESNTALGDTWEWDGLRWMETTPSSGGPSARSSFAMAWDEGAERIVLHGGVGELFDDLLDDTWTYEDGAWSALGAPSGRRRQGPAMTFDPVRGHLVMFGGTSTEPFDPTGPSDFVELLEDGSWVSIPDPNPFARPPDRTLARMATDFARGRVILYGGRPELYAKEGGSYAVLSDTWIWDGANWTELRADQQPPVAPAAITYDPSTASLLVYGGTLYGAGVGVGNFSHTFDGNVWIDAESISSDTDPTSTNAAAAPFDGGVALVEQNSGQTYQWYGYSWYAFAPAPNLAGAVSMAEAPPSMGGGQSALLTGGDAGDAETWLLSDADYAWSRICDGGAGQSCPYGDALTYDSARALVVAVDDSGTWEHDGVSWTLRADVLTPPLTQNAQATFDTVEQRVLLYPGDGGAAQVFEYDGTVWFAIDSTQAPAQPLSAFAFDPISSRAILTGGLVAGVSVADTWALAPSGRPAQLLQFAFGAAEFADVELLEADLDVVAGGSAPGGDGVEVLVWSDARFVPIAEADSGTQSRSLLRARADTNALSRALLGSERALVFAVTPRYTGADAQSRSTIALDEAVLTVRYVLDN